MSVEAGSEPTAEEIREADVARTAMGKGYRLARVAEGSYSLTRLSDHEVVYENSSLDEIEGYLRD